MGTYSKKHSNFVKDLAEGQAGERKVIEILSRAVPCEQTDGRKSDVGFTVANCKLLAEVKFDKMSCKTGNIALEYGNPNSGKETGLLASNSDLWCFVFLTGEVWVAKTDLVKKFFNDVPGRDVWAAGDGNANCRLYKKNVVLGPLFIRIDNLESSQLRLLLNEMFNPNPNE